VPSVLSVGSLRLAPPGLTPAEIPPEESGARLRVIVVPVEVDSFVFAAVESEVCPGPDADDSSCDRVGGITIGAETTRTSATEGVTAVGCAAGLDGGAITAARAR
jgi:hypothetical protein